MENRLYNKNRELTIRRLMEKMIMLYQEGIKVCLDSEIFLQDRVHFNFKDNGVLGKVIISALKSITNRNSSRN